jgi:hypothetical protein
MKLDYAKLLLMVPNKRGKLETVAKQYGLKKLPEITVVNSSLEELEQDYGRKLDWDDIHECCLNYVVVRKNAYRAFHAETMTDEQIDVCAIRTIAFLLGTVTYNYKYLWVGLLLFWKKPGEGYWLKSYLVEKYTQTYLEVLTEP